MNITYFLLGNTPQLSLLELETIFPKQVKSITANLAQVTSEDQLDASKLISILGGTVKVLQPQTSWPKTDQNITADLITYFTQQLSQPDQRKFEFGLKNININPDLMPIPQDIKSELKSVGKKIRYVDSGMLGVSTALLLHHPQVRDYFLIQNEKNTYLLKTTAVQDINDWTKKDRSKPYFDRKKGMIPPKVGRMMVNIGANQTYQQLSSNSQTTKTIYDPFCGTGTILMEAALLGYNTVGSDIDKAAVFGTQDNLNWLGHNYQVKHSPTVFTADVSHAASKYTFPKKIDLIVTEPFLGKPKPNPKQVPNIIKGLEKMYLGAFNEWQKILKPGARVSIVFPAISTPKKEFTMANFVDKLHTLGYTTASGPITYARKLATVKRQHYVFTYQGAKG